VVDPLKVEGLSAFTFKPMKRVLSLLLMIVFLQASIAPAFAKRGGPDLAGYGAVNTVGTFAGVLIPEELDRFEITPNRNSIGLFSLGVPSVGIATGSIVIFVEGTAFNGDITGIADPLNGQLSAIIDATSTYDVVDPVTGITTSVFAQGNLEAEIKDILSNNFIASQQTAGFTFATTRIEGTARVAIFGSLNADGTPDVSDVASYLVDGFKQSDTVTVADVSITPGGGGTGGGGTTP
jgi:hypothetical protein